jgi:hypothetical protein
MTRSNYPAPGRGWQATPGQPIPRAVRQPAANGLLLVMLLLVWFSPLSIVAWLLGQAVILFQRRWHWWRFALAALAWIVLVLVVIGPEEALRRHIFVPQRFWQYAALRFGFGPPGTRVTVGQFLWDLVATQVWLALPVGLLAASLSVWYAERAAGGAEWSPFVRRRQRIDQRARDRRTARLVARPRDYKLAAPALGIALDGDLASWRHGHYVVPPAQLRGKGMAVVGAPEPRASAEAQQSGAAVLTKRAQAERVYAQLSANGAPVSAGQLAAAAGLSASYARALVAQFHARPATALQRNGRRLVAADTDSDARP